MSDTPRPPQSTRADLTVEPPEERDQERPASGASAEDLPTSGELDAAPLDAMVDEASEVAPADSQVLDPVTEPGPDREAPVLDPGAVHTVPEEAVFDGGADVEQVRRADDAPVDTPEGDEPALAGAAAADARADAVADAAEGGGAPEAAEAAPPQAPPRVDPVAADAAEAAADPAPEATDDLDDLLDIVGAGPQDGDAYPEPGDTMPAEHPEAPTAVAVADDDGRADGEAATAAPAVRPRPRAITQVRDQSDLRRMLGDWYVVHTYAGYEQRVKDNLLSRVESLDAHDRIFEVVIPTEEVTEFKKGKKTTVQRKFLPGYVLVRMLMDDDTWGIVRHTPAVTGFVGSPGSRPVPLSLREVAGTLRIPETVVEEVAGEAVTEPSKPEIDIDLDLGETIRVTSGPFADFTGTIAEINVDQAKLKVLVSVFGRETPLELPFDNVAKL